MKNIKTILVAAAMFALLSCSQEPAHDPAAYESYEIVSSGTNLYEWDTDTGAGWINRDVRVVRSPYRICPLGAHVDHQLGRVTGMAIDRSILLAFVPTDDASIHQSGDDFAHLQSASPVGVDHDLLHITKFDRSVN